LVNLEPSMAVAKRIFFGSAAAIAAISAAQADNIGSPTAPPVDYAQVCSLGSFTGFILPGSDVCFDVSGFARGEMNVTEGNPFQFNATGTAAATEASAAAIAAAGFSTLVIRMSEDTQAAMAAAPFVLDDPNIFGSTLSSGTDTITVFLYDVNGNGTEQIIDIQYVGYAELMNGILADTGSDDDLDLTGNARLEFDARSMTEHGLLRGFIRLDGENSRTANIDRAFVQLNTGALGVTAGLADSVFDPVFTGYGSGTALELGLADQASSQVSVNAAIGNGVTLSLSLEDNDARDGNFVTMGLDDPGNAIELAILFGTAEYDSASMPNVVAAARIDQAWGSAKLAGALNEVNPAGSTVDSELGFAVSASANINIPVGVGSTVGFAGIHAHGAQQFMGFNTVVGNSATAFADAIIVSDFRGAAPVSTLHLTTSYVLAAGFNFGVSEQLSLSIDGSYADVDHHDSLFDGNVTTVRGGVAYTPIDNLRLDAALAYAQADFEPDAFRAAGSVDDSEWSARFRVTRSF
jgi:hypothetical protein